MVCLIHVLCIFRAVWGILSSSLFLTQRLLACVLELVLTMKHVSFFINSSCIIGGRLINCISVSLSLSHSLSLSLSLSLSHPHPRTITIAYEDEISFKEADIIVNINQVYRRNSLFVCILKCAWMVLYDSSVYILSAIILYK